MKKLLYIAVVIIMASCAGSKSTTTTSTTTGTTPSIPAPPAVDVTTATTITGNWDYIVTGTPDGDFKGVLVITPAASAFSAKMVSASGEIPVEKFLFTKETNKITGEVPYNGFMVGLDATMAGEALKGTMFAGGMDFPFTATRKK